MVLYGTDVSVGIARKTAAYNSHPRSFVTLIGIDGNSWGYSYTGFLHHDDSNTSESKESPKAYGTRRWGPGSIIGVHYNGWNGTLEFYLDRVPLGVAFRDLPINDELYPIVSSTAAKSGLSLICAQSYPCNLAYECVRQLSRASLKNKEKGIRTYLKNDNVAQTSLLVANNMFLLLKGGINTGRDIAYLNKSWIRILPPGLQNFINEHCWYLVGSRPIKLGIGEKWQQLHRFTSIGDFDHAECLRHSDDSSDDSKDCDMNVTDDEIEASSNQPSPNLSQINRATKNWQEKERINPNKTKARVVVANKRKCNRSLEETKSALRFTPRNIREESNDVSLQATCSYSNETQISTEEARMQPESYIDSIEIQNKIQLPVQGKDNQMEKKSRYLAKQVESPHGMAVYSMNNPLVATSHISDSSDEDDIQNFFGYTKQRKLKPEQGYSSENDEEFLKTDRCAGTKYGVCNEDSSPNTTNINCKPCCISTNTGSKCAVNELINSKRDIAIIESPGSSPTTSTKTTEAESRKSKRKRRFVLPKDKRL